jgi:hypothetical protein
VQYDIDPEDIRLPDIVVPAPELRATKIDLPPKTRDYLRTDMTVLGEFANALTMTWARILQLDHMETKKQKDPRKRWFNLTMDWFERHGISPDARQRALRRIEKAGRIQTRRRRVRHNPEVRLIQRAKRHPRS